MQVAGADATPLPHCSPVLALYSKPNTLHLGTLPASPAMPKLWREASPEAVLAEACRFPWWDMALVQPACQLLTQHKASESRGQTDGALVGSKVAQAEQLSCERWHEGPVAAKHKAPCHIDAQGQCLRPSLVLGLGARRSEAVGCLRTCGAAFMQQTGFSLHDHVAVRAQMCSDQPSCGAGI